MLPTQESYPVYLITTEGCRSANSVVLVQALTCPASFEKEFLKYVADPFPATLVAAILTVLSSHAENEHYLGDEDQGFIYVSPRNYCTSWQPVP